METLKAIQNRNSVARLAEPAPTTDEMEQVYKCALRAPDHAWLRPWKFIEIRGDSRKRLADSFIKASIASGEEMTDELKEKLEKAPFRAPMVIVLTADIKEHKKTNSILKVTVDFVGEVITCIKDKNKKIISGNPDKIKKIYDTWVFSRDIKSKNPNWLLVDILT